MSARLLCKHTLWRLMKLERMRKLTQMHFKGSLGIKHFHDLDGKKLKIPMELRRHFQQAFWTAIGSALLDYGLRIPVLTGDTRKSVFEVLTFVDIQLTKAGGSGQFAPALDYKSMTDSKYHSDDYPEEISEKVYKKATPWPKGRPQAMVHTRSEWRAAVLSHGHEPRGNTAAHMDYIGKGNQSTGQYTFFFSHGPDYWIEYDQVGINGHGPWDLTGHFRETVQKNLDDLIFATAARITVGFATQVDASYSLGRSGNPVAHMGDEYTKMPHLDMEMEYLG